MVSVEKCYSFNYQYLCPGLALLIAGIVQYSNTPDTTPTGSDNGLGTLIAGGVILLLGLIFAGK